MKTDQYLLSVNPLNSDKRIFILHTGSPKILAEVFHFGIYQDKELQDCQRRYRITETVRYKSDLICFAALWTGETDTSTEATDKLSEAMSGMRDWYYTYLQSKSLESV